MTPHQGNTLLLRSSQQLPRLLKRLFELTRRHRLRANDLPRALLLELQRNKDPVSCAPLAAGEVPGHGQEQLSQTLM